MNNSMRAAFVALHLFFVLILALPNPVVEGDKVETPGVQMWFDRTHSRVVELGIDIDREVFEQRLLTLAWGYKSARDVVMKPANTYGLWTGARQSWRMFGDVPQESARMVIERLSENGRWEPVYVPRSREANWRRAFFEQERMRSLVNQFAHEKARSAWKRLGRRLRPMLVEDFPEAEGFRMVMERVHFPTASVLAQTREVEVGKRYWATRLVEPAPAEAELEAGVAP